MFYKLDSDGVPVRCDSAEWGEWFMTNDRKVSETNIKWMGHDIQVSTVFLGLDHGIDDGDPVLWESMVFGLPDGNDLMERCSGTRQEAKFMHRRVQARLRDLLKELEEEEGQEEPDEPETQPELPIEPKPRRRLKIERYKK